MTYLIPALKTTYDVGLAGPQDLIFPHRESLILYRILEKILISNAAIRLMNKKNIKFIPPKSSINAP